MSIMSFCSTILLFFLLLASVSAAENSKSIVDGTSADMWGAAGVKTNLVRGAWLKNSRFAMFIHWGLYSELDRKSTRLNSSH